MLWRNTSCPTWSGWSRGSQRSWASRAGKFRTSWEQVLTFLFATELTRRMLMKMVTSMINLQCSLRKMIKETWFPPLEANASGSEGFPLPSPPSSKSTWAAKTIYGRLECQLFSIIDHQHNEKQNNLSSSQLSSMKSLASNPTHLFSGRPRRPANPYPDRAATAVGQLLGDHDLRVIHTPIHGARDRLQLVPLASAW